MTSDIEREDPEWCKLSQKWLEIRHQMHLLEAEEKTLRDAIIQLAGDQNVTGGGLRVKRLTRKGLVQYAQIPELQNVDLEKYRKEPLTVWHLQPLTKKK